MKDFSTIDIDIDAFNISSEYEFDKNKEKVDNEKEKSIETLIDRYNKDYNEYKDKYLSLLNDKEWNLAVYAYVGLKVTEYIIDGLKLYLDKLRNEKKYETLFKYINPGELFKYKGDIFVKMVATVWREDTNLFNAIKKDSSDNNNSFFYFKDEDIVYSMNEEVMYDNREQKTSN